MTIPALLGAAALLNAILAGFYFAYATVITGQRAAAGAEAMIRMNAAVERPPFIALFLLAPVVAVVSAGWLLVADGARAAGVAALVAAVCAVAACVSTMAVNVPLNQRLGAGAVDWAEYARTWGAWNVGRAWLCAAAAAGLGAAALA
ncbi:anthrone oxygenase family protein [Tsukamurella ocularis]|uniref:anthrone oxygenase family protein n=1 Tax=Tsukamurella ocularis TaxID=1970234 RepID=UPI0039EE44C9